MSEHELAGSARIHGPGDLLQAVPYLLGFHPVDSLVLIGLDGAHLVVTARMDLSDVAEPEAVAHTLAALSRGGAARVLCVVYDSVSDGAADGASRGDRTRRPPSWGGLAAALQHDCDLAGCELSDVLRVAGGRWWSLLCTDPRCCPPGGNLVPAQPSPFVAAATYAGVVALPDRQALADTLRPLPAPQRAALRPLVRQQEAAAARAGLDGSGRRHERELLRALFAAARQADAGPRDEDGGVPLGPDSARERTGTERTGTAPSDAEVAGFGAALSTLYVRDRLWLAIDGGRLDGRELWRELARRLPAPYDAPALFLFGWASWRDGNGALALIAAERAIESDRHYTAADLLLATLSHGLDPRHTPPLRPRRSPTSGPAKRARRRSPHAA